MGGAPHARASQVSKTIFVVAGRESPRILFPLFYGEQEAGPASPGHLLPGLARKRRFQGPEQIQAHSREVRSPGADIRFNRTQLAKLRQRADAGTCEHLLGLWSKTPQVADLFCLVHARDLQNVNRFSPAGAAFSRRYARVLGSALSPVLVQMSGA